MIAETERLVLREQTMDDLDPLTEILGDPVTMSFYPRAFNRDQVRTWIERSMKLYESRGFGLWAMILKETGEFVGQCGLTVQDVEGVPLVEIGWHVDRIHWRRGYASEAAAAARDRGFDLGLVKLVSLILPANVPSAGVARKIGMEIERDVDHKGLRHNLWALTKPPGTGLRG